MTDLEIYLEDYRDAKITASVEQLIQHLRWIYKSEGEIATEEYIQELEGLGLNPETAKAILIAAANPDQPYKITRI